MDHAPTPLLPARMVNEYVYCPRLAYLMWVQQEWSDSHDTVDGRRIHKRVDADSGDLPEREHAADDDEAPGDEAEQTIHARAVTLASEGLGVIARLDLVEGEGDLATPVDYKRGKRPHIARGAYDPERVQLCLQGLLLREHGWRSEAGLLYYAESRERVRVDFDDELLDLTRRSLDGLRAIAARSVPPEPLDDSPKCPRCALAAICMPDEINYLRRPDQAPRALFVQQDEALPLYVQAYGAKVTKRGENLEVWVDDHKAAEAHLGDTSQLVVQGPVYVTAPALGALMQRQIPVTWTSHGGWFYGHSVGTGHKNVDLRTAQYRASFDDARCLAIARDVVAAKVRNQRTLLRRNYKAGELPEDLLDQFRRDIDQAERAHSLEQLLGIEGAAAARYFRHFSAMFAPAKEGELGFGFEQRNRRPPRDPVNALLSYAYSVLVRTFTVVLSAVGFDPYRGFYHQPRYGRPALALDLMEPFRPLIADSVVIQVINNGEIRTRDFTSAAGAVAIRPEGRKRLIAAFERRLSHEVTHPLFEYTLSYRRLIELQARLFGRHLLGEIEHYPHFVTR